MSNIVVVDHPLIQHKLSILRSKEATVKEFRELAEKHCCRHITVMNILGCPAGVSAVLKAHPDVILYVAHIDDCLNEQAYILPGLGDADDRIFGTK